MTIKHTIQRLLAALAVLVLTAGLGWAQTSLTTTTLSTGMTDSSGTSAVVASATGITAPGTGANLIYLYIDSEAMAVRAISGTTVTVQRGANGTRATSHPINSFVYVAPPAALTTVDYGGSCTASAQTYLPVINVRSGNIWNCVSSTVGQTWQGYNLVPLRPTAQRTVVGGVQTAAGLVSPNTAIGLNYTILPSDYIVVLATSGTTPGSLATAIKSFTLPSAVGLAGKQLIITDESGAITATTSIILIGTIDGTNSAVATVVQMKTAYQSVGLHAGSGGWYLDFCTGASVAGLNSGPASCR